MRLKKEDKVQLAEQLANKLQETKAVIFANYQGLKVKEIQGFRNKLADEGMEYMVAKNTVLQHALKNAGQDVTEDILSQPLALVFTQDEIAGAKAAYTFNRSAENYQILGAIIDGRFVSKEIIEQFAQLPSREELYAKVVGTLSAPFYRLRRALTWDISKLVNVLHQYQASKS